ncbi:MAG: hypothetical protein IPM89_12265 [Candidatus Competibacteraceae bacterium]|nr:MAG: hypothetical protein IPM89_12265 [Candidatus Competibacteraceae bacterium]
MQHQHIHEETHILFPSARQIPPPEIQDTLVTAFERIERQDIDPDLKPKCLALVETLEHEVGLR